MDYRDERDALRGRVENLEEELVEAKRELAEVKGTHAAPEAEQAAGGSPPDEAAFFPGGTAVSLFAALGAITGPPMVLIGLCFVTAIAIGDAGYGYLMTFATLAAAGAAFIGLFILDVSIAARRAGPAPFTRWIGWEVVFRLGVGALLIGAGALYVVGAWGGYRPSGLALALPLATSWLGAACLATFFLLAPRVR